MTDVEPLLPPCLQEIRKLLDGGHWVTATDLAAAMNIIERTVATRIERLRIAGYRVECSKETYPARYRLDLNAGINPKQRRVARLPQEMIDGIRAARAYIILRGGSGWETRCEGDIVRVLDATLNACEERK